MAGNSKTYLPFRFFIYSRRLSTVHRCNERATLRTCFCRLRLSSGRLLPIPNTSTFRKVWKLSNQPKTALGLSEAAETLPKPSLFLDDIRFDKRPSKS